MLKKVGAALGVVLAGVFALAYWSYDSKMAACTGQAGKLNSAYQASRPKGATGEAIEPMIKRARTLCREKQYEKAVDTMKGAALLCMVQKGCAPLIEEAKRRREASR
jgi:hypothetical protein